MEYFKKAAPQAAAVTQEIKSTVSQIISDVEREGVDAVRRDSEKFDGFAPASFRLSEAEIAAQIAGPKGISVVPSSLRPARRRIAAVARPNSAATKTTVGSAASPSQAPAAASSLASP